MTTFSKGDVVRLKSGSPRMTVAAVNAGTVALVRTNNVGDLNQAPLDPALLELDRQRHS